MRNVHRLSGVGAAVAALAFVSGVTAGAATAAEMRGAWYDDEPNLAAYNSYWDSNAAGWWQNVLCADSKFTGQALDGYFGTTTKNRTMQWQSSKGLNADGVVGYNTYVWAQNYIMSWQVFDNNYTAVYRWNGSRNDFYMSWNDYNGSTDWDTNNESAGIGMTGPYYDTEYLNRSTWSSGTC